MDHLAILRKARIKKGDNLLGDILNGRKTIESRWYVHKIAPWGKISKGDTVYFKESGGLVTAKASVSNVLYYSDLNLKSVEEIIDKYGKKIAPDTNKEDFLKWAREQGNKKYCILVFLEKVEKVMSFEINKSGFGSACAWMVVGNIEKVRV